MKKFFLASMVLAIPLCAQPFGGGLKVGAPLTDAISLTEGSDGGFASTNRYIIGPYGEIRLPAGFSIEVDALYRSFSYQTVSGLGSAFGESNGNWEFPVMAKYKLTHTPVAKPYIDGGLVLSHLTGSDINVTHAANYGITVGAGVEIKIAALRISPELRYDGFFFNTFSSNSLVQSNKNQALFLVGIGF
jgi:opacity protein-like surface antigen